MKKSLLFSYTFFSFIIILSQSAFSQPDPRYIDSRDLAVMISVEVNEQAPSITLNWTGTDIARGYSVYRKTKEQDRWQMPAVFTAQEPLNTYTDTEVEAGVEYEYMVIADQIGSMILQKQGGGDTTVARPAYGFGYASAGIKAPAKDLPGTLLLLVDETVNAALPSEVSRLVKDLVGEGWNVKKHVVPRSEDFDGEQVKDNKQIILDEYNENPGRNITVLLLGRVAVPYSGRLNPDAHGNHIGAWPADLYYGSMSEINWTDTQINDISASREANHNVPGDGKFDVSGFTKGFVEFPVGRIDFYNMPQFEDSEMDLIKKYLDKNHAYRTGSMDYEMRGLVDDNFGARKMLEAFASSGWRNLGAFFGGDNVEKIDFFTTLKTDNYMWSYGTGGGSYKSAGGIGATKDFSEKQVKSVFTILFGSYFGDWDSQDNFLRAPLASEPSALTCAWAGRPPWYFHHMNMGEPIGYSTVLSQNAKPGELYSPNAYVLSGTQAQIVCYGYQQIHVALMGDPTLKMYMGDRYSAPPQNISLKQPFGEGVIVSWQDPSAEVDGFYVYRSKYYDGPYERVSGGMVQGTSWQDTAHLEGNYFYMVRSVKLQESNGGTYYNVSRASEDAIAGIAATGVDDIDDYGFNVSCYPNPAVEYAFIQLTLPTENFGELSVSVYDASGRLVKELFNDNVSAGTLTIKWDLTAASGNKISPGIYIAEIKYGNYSKTLKLAVIK